MMQQRVGLGVMFMGRVLPGVFRPDVSINGVLGGLVAVTAGPEAVTPQGAVLLGLVGGVAAFWRSWVLENRFRLNDPRAPLSTRFAGPNDDGDRAPGVL